MIAVAILSLIALVDLVVFDRIFSQKGHPEFTLAFNLRSLAILVASALIVSYILRTNPREHGWSPGGPSPSWPYALVLLVIGIAVYFIGLFHYSPILFGWFTREDSFIEASEFWMLTAGAVVMAIALIRSRLRRKSLATLTVIALPVIGFLIVALEEISWGQRLFGFETTGHFGQNLQGETNLHNFMTNHSEILFYFGSFIWFVLLAFIADRTNWLRSLPWLKTVIPSRAFIFLMAPAVAFNYGEWDQIPTQFAIFATVLILGLYTLEAIHSKTLTFERAVMAVAFVGVIAIQTILLLQGHLMLRLWQNTEYKELLLILPAMIWAFEVLLRDRLPDQT